MTSTPNLTPRKLYALLVGINDYPEGVSSLKGCVEDIQAFQQYLELRVAHQDGFDLQPPHILLNEQATRQAVIDGFRGYLAQAEANDVALFYYAGHGSQKETPPELAKYEPDGMNETLVCWDSRLEGSWDLFDRELAFLISEFAQKQPHFVAILDCCHSGHGLRDIDELIEPGPYENTVRQVKPDHRFRPVSTMLFSLPDLKTIARSRDLDDNPSQWIFPNSRHILLAACRDRETAQETQFSTPGKEHPVRRGVFSYYLQETLKKSKGSPTYRDLFNETKALVLSKVTGQTPQMEAVQENSNQPFLGGAVVQCPSYYTVRFDRDHAWAINGGAVHGIPQPKENEKVLLALFPQKFDLEQSFKIEDAIAIVAVSQVLPHLSRLQIPETIQLDPQTTYKALVVTLPLPPFAVAFAGNDQQLVQVQQAIQKANPVGERSLYIRLAGPSDQPEFCVVAQGNQFYIYRTGEDLPLAKPVDGRSESGAVEVVRQLEHIARWTVIARLNNTAHSQLNDHAIQLRFFAGEGDTQNPQEITDSSLRLTYSTDGKEPTFKISLTNTSTQPLHCAILCLGEDFSITSNIIGESVELQPNTTIWANDGTSFYGIVPKQLWDKGVTEYTDTCVVIACRQAFDATLLEQDGLNISTTRDFNKSREPKLGNGTLNRLMNRVMTRPVSKQPEQSETCDNWMIKRVSITFVRPR